MDLGSNSLVFVRLLDSGRRADSSVSGSEQSGSSLKLLPDSLAVEVPTGTQG
jgi:hypothetical protein